MNTKLDLSKPAGYPPKVSDNKGNKKKLNGPNDSDYVEFQTKLLSLSQNSKEIIAARSGHYVIIDGPDAVIDATNQVVRSVRTNSKL